MSNLAGCPDIIGTRDKKQCLSFNFTLVARTCMCTCTSIYMYIHVYKFGVYSMYIYMYIPVLGMSPRTPLRWG